MLMVESLWFFCTRAGLTFVASFVVTSVILRAFLDEGGFSVLCVRYEPLSVNHWCIICVGGS